MFHYHAYLGGWIQAIENPNPEPGCLVSCFVVVKGVRPPLAVASGSGPRPPSPSNGSSSKCRKKLLSSLIRFLLPENLQCFSGEGCGSSSIVITSSMLLLSERRAIMLWGPDVEGPGLDWIDRCWFDVFEPPLWATRRNDPEISLKSKKKNFLIVKAKVQGQVVGAEKRKGVKKIFFF